MPFFSSVPSKMDFTVAILQKKRLKRSQRSQRNYPQGQSNTGQRQNSDQLRLVLSPCCIHHYFKYINYFTNMKHTGVNYVN